MIEYVYNIETCSSYRDKSITSNSLVKLPIGVLPDAVNYIWFDSIFTGSFTNYHYYNDFIISDGDVGIIFPSRPSSKKDISSMALYNTMQHPALSCPNLLY